ncbi:MAG: GTP-binding protein [Gaiellaceae bacterium]
MSQKELNLGILAHVDAGKTTLTERLLYEAGVIRDVGSVDAGTTQTDTLALERLRGITIKSAVTSFAIGDVHVNLIDTPGHPDFIAEVERVLSVLDGAVLVISAVEGVQPKTRILMRALKRLRVPTLMFVNKIYRAGADDERVLQAISERLTTSIVPMGRARSLGERGASFTRFDAPPVELLAEHDDEILVAYVSDDARLSVEWVRAALAKQTQLALVHPVFFGAAITGAGVSELAGGIAELLPSASGDPDAALAATVFKIERGPGGDKIAYARVFSGTLTVRDRVAFGRDGEGKVTALAVFEHGGAVPRPSARAGAIAKVWGLHEIQIGDRIGDARSGETTHAFAPPTLESVVEAIVPEDSARLRAALAQLDEQDPLISVRQHPESNELSVSLYGEVQKEVIQALLESEYGIAVEFRQTTPIHIERPAGVGEGVELLHAESNPYSATLGLRVEPAAIGSGLEFRLGVDIHSVPLYMFKRRDDFGEAMTEYVREALLAGLFGWQVTDCVVTLTRCEYGGADGPPSKRGQLSTAGDLRGLTPLVIRQALERAGTVVCAPVVRARVEVPSDSIGAVLPMLARLGTVARTPSLHGRLATIETLLPAARAHELQQRLPSLTGGEGVFESKFAGYEPVSGTAPRRGGSVG